MPISKLYQCSALSDLVHLYHDNFLFFFNDDNFQLATDSRAAEKMSNPREAHSKTLQKGLYCYTVFVCLALLTCGMLSRENAIAKVLFERYASIDLAKFHR